MLAARALSPSPIWKPISDMLSLAPPVVPQHMDRLKEILACPAVTEGLVPYLADHNIFKNLFEQPAGASTLWVVLLENTPVGAVGLYKRQLLIFLDPQHQRRGLGRKTLSLCLAQLRADGFDDVEAEVARSNRASRALFLSSNFQEGPLIFHPAAREPLVSYHRQL